MDQNVNSWREVITGTMSVSLGLWGLQTYIYHGTLVLLYSAIALILLGGNDYWKVYKNERRTD
jgi:hypothetical protein